METRQIYLDHAATTPMRREVWAAMERVRDRCLNPASTHAFGRESHRLLEEARDRIAGLFGCERREIFFTGGGTMSDNLAILGFARMHGSDRPRVLVSAVEHKAVLEAAARAEEEGAEVHVIPVRGCGTIELDALERRLVEGEGAPTIVSVMWANNEVGTIQPVDRIARLAHAHGATLHTDAVQALGKTEVKLDRLEADFLTATAHKIGGPVGIGLLYSRGGAKLEPIAYGGQQERSMWPGTQNPMAATGFAEACHLAFSERETHMAEWRILLDRLTDRLLAGIPGARVHGADAAERLPSLLSLGVPACDPGALLVSLDLEGIAVSGGSACGSDSGAGSQVLEEMGITGDAAYAAVRFSFGHGTTAEEVDLAADATVRAANRIVASTV